MNARRIRHDVIGPTETGRHRPFNVVYDTGEELFLGTCCSRRVQRRDSRQHEFGHEDRLIRKTGNSNRSVEEIWINTGYDNLRHLRTDIKLTKAKSNRFIWA
ncbi:unnamed protein product [Angiostrongylus costaricensis]|uniref:WYL domain-containing protein n=1 Tax=Angiostrongylus costaricensis TaxID=334426 RepID=A0A0R3PZM9_ANGCS|nr:unnamed protein product [Angiostrongylus costaricensis]